MILLIDGFVKLPSWHKLLKEQNNGQVSKAVSVIQRATMGLDFWFLYGF